MIMDFMDALQNMINGQRMMRIKWVGYWVCILPTQAYIWTIPVGGKNPAVNASIYIPTIEDLSATDWIIKTN